MEGAKKILLVDDEDDIREVAQISLETVSAWEVLTVSSGSEALGVARSVKPDVILLDVMMPDMDGPTTFRKLQAEVATRDIPVILLTAKVQSADRRQFSDLGVRGVIAKPFDPLTLSQQVAEILKWKL